MDTNLPPALAHALEAALIGRSQTDLASRARALSSAYRGGRNSNLAIRAESDAWAYAAVRMPATYAAISQALAQVMGADPDFAPETCLDLGAGPGTAAWAALTAWPNIQQLTLIDQSGPLEIIARHLAGQATAPALKNYAQITLDFSRAAPSLTLPTADLLLAAYVLAELTPDACAQLVKTAWDSAKGLFVIVEPGTQEGHQRLMAARKQLIDAGARIAAPCPGEMSCPLASPDWCRFSARLSRSALHRRAKDGTRSFEDEPYAFIAATKRPLDRATGARIIRDPAATKIGIELSLCTASGLETRKIPRRDRSAFNAHRKLRWGDGLAT
jgi:ribosomal protein RSM22 (predicted rRNA methylase)